MTLEIVTVGNLCILVLQVLVCLPPRLRTQSLMIILFLMKKADVYEYCSESQDEFAVFTAHVSLPNAIRHQLLCISGLMQENNPNSA